MTKNNSFASAVAEGKEGVKFTLDGVEYKSTPVLYAHQLGLVMRLNGLGLANNLAQFLDEPSKEKWVKAMADEKNPVPVNVMIEISELIVNHFVGDLPKG